MCSPTIARRRRTVSRQQLLEQARKILGAATMKDTVNRSLAEVVRADQRRRHARRLVEMDGLDLNDAEVMDQAWR